MLLLNTTMGSVLKVILGPFGGREYLIDLMQLGVIGVNVLWLHVCSVSMDHHSHQAERQGP